MHWGGLLSPAVTSPQAQEREREREVMRGWALMPGGLRERGRESLRARGFGSPNPFQASNGRDHTVNE